MSSIAADLNKVLPAPKHAAVEDPLSSSSSSVPSSRILGAADLERQQLVLKKVGPPPYGQRAAWRPRSQEDYGDGGAFPEIPVAQYPLDLGRKGKGGGRGTKAKALSVQVDADGRVQYDAIARQGHDSGRIVHASFKDLIPLRQRADAGDVSLDRPDAAAVAATAERTQLALDRLVAGAVAAQKPGGRGAGGRGGASGAPAAQYVRYTPGSQMGDGAPKPDRLVKIVAKQLDPMEPPKFRHRKIPRGPGSPPPPVMHSPPRRLTAADQEAWAIPPPVSNWKNPKGYTVPLDKRLAADGRGLQDVTINDRFAQFSEALFTADRHAREEVKQRALMQQKLAEKEKAAKEEHIHELAQRAREAALAHSHSHSRPRRSGSVGSNRSARSGSRSRSRSRAGSGSGSDSEDDEAVRERERMRRERRAEDQRQLRMKRMGQERKMQVLAREQGRDISEKMALGLAKPTLSRESMYDSRLFSQASAFGSGGGGGGGGGFNEDNPYDKPLFAAAEAVNAIYRPRVQRDGEDDDDEGGAQNELDRIQRNSRFEVLGRAQKGFRGAADADARDGPVQFEKDKDAAADAADPFGVEAFVRSVGEEVVNNRKHGLHVQAGAASTKRPRNDSD